MPPTVASSGPALPVRSQQPDSPFGAIAFQLDYLSAKLTSIREEYGEDLHADLAHDLHSAWDAVHVAQAALSSVPAETATPGEPWPDGTCAVDVEEYFARWDRANEPISELLRDKSARAIAEWAAARARYEQVFVEAVRPAPANRTARAARLREAEAELDRACETLRDARAAPAQARSK